MRGRRLERRAAVMGSPRSGAIFFLFLARAPAGIPQLGPDPKEQLPWCFQWRIFAKEGGPIPLVNYRAGLINAAGSIRRSWD